MGQRSRSLAAGVEQSGSPGGIVGCGSGWRAEESCIAIACPTLCGQAMW
jgi:hypothetical protein